MENEKRLIDAYALMNQVRESKRKNPHTDSNIARNHMFEHDHLMKMVCLAPTVDAVEVVRCKDCRSADYSGCASGMVYCLEHSCYMEESGYCSNGEREVEHGKTD